MSVISSLTSCHRLPIRALHTRTEVTKRWVRQIKLWIENVKEDVHEKDSNIQEVSTPWKDRQKCTIFIQPHRQQPVGDPDGEWRTREINVTRLRPAKTSKHINVLFGIWTPGGSPRNTELSVWFRCSYNVGVGIWCGHRQITLATCCASEAAVAQ